MAPPLVVFAVPSCTIPELPAFARLVADATAAEPIKAIVVVNESFPKQDEVVATLEEVFTGGVTVIFPSVPYPEDTPNPLGALFEFAAKSVPLRHKGRWLWAEVGNFAPIHEDWIGRLLIASDNFQVTGAKAPVATPAGVPDGDKFLPGALTIPADYWDYTSLAKFAKYQITPLGTYLRGEFLPNSGDYGALVARIEDGPDAETAALVGPMHIIEAEEGNEVELTPEELEGLKLSAKAAGAQVPEVPPILLAPRKRTSQQKRRKG